MTNMPYYPTIEEDLARAKEILAKGKYEPALPAELKVEGTIHGGDIYVAYKLLKSFVAEIERLHAQNTDCKICPQRRCNAYGHRGITRRFHGPLTGL